MNRTLITCALVLTVSSLSGACSDDTADDDGGSGTGGAMGGATSGAGGSGASGGATGTGGASGGATGTGGASGTAGSSSGGSTTTGGVGGDSSVGGVTGGAVIGGSSSGDAGVGGAGAGQGGAAGTSGGRGGVGGFNIGGNDAGAGPGPSAMMNFFVTSDTAAMNGNLGGLAMADMRCQRLAMAVGQGGKTWRAYLSVASPMTHATNRIGDGPYYNSAGVLVAMDKAALHARMGDAAVFIDERGNRVNGQWQDSPTPNQHDILTGSQANGMLSTGNTCSDWTATTGNAEVGHSDGLGPNMATTGTYTVWNASHTAPCGNLASTGRGAGKLYCFVGP